MISERVSHLGALSALTLATAVLAFGCANPAPDPDTAETASAKIVEIPVTTGSEAARELFEAGQYLLDVGRGVQAREKFQAAIAEDPGFVRAHFNQSNSSLSFKEFKTCLDMASEHLEKVSEGERMMVEINRTFLTNDNERGRQLATELTEKYPNSPRAAMILAGLRGGQNDNTGARESFNRALDLDPGSPGALFGLANNYLFGEPKDFEKAEELARRLIGEYPDEAKGHEVLGDIKRAQNDLEAALEAYNTATEMNPADPAMAVAQLKKGHVNSFLGNIEDARAAYDAGIADAPIQNKAAYANYRAFTHIHGGDVEGSLDELGALAAKVEEMGTPPDQVKGVQVFSLTNYATAALHAGLLDRAAEAIAHRNELQMSIAEDVGTDDARRLNEANCQVWDGLLAAHRGDRGGAERHAEGYLALIEGDDNPRKAEPAHWVLGMAALKAGDHTGAVEHLRQADHANTMYIRYHLALAEEAAGNSEEARKLFAEVADWNFNSVGFALVHEDAKRRATA